jgi:sulfur dioxygenase
MLFRQLFDPETSTWTYLLADESTREAVLIDPVLEQVERDLTLLRELELTLRYAVDTHVHADHVTGAGTLRERTGAHTVLSERGGTGRPDVLVKQGDLVRFGAYALEVRETPGHTSGCVSYVVRDGARTLVFTGDALLIRGSGRTDFQQGDARTLHRSVTTQLFTLPEDALVYPGHDYKGRTVSTIGEEKRHNPRLGGGRSADDFAAIMAALVLAQPKQIDRAVPANLQCGVPAGLRADGERETERGWAPVERTAAGVSELTAEWLAAHAGTLRLVDVREPAEFVGPLGHVAGAELVPLATVEEAAARWERTQPLVVVCRSGGRSAKAALTLEALGFTRVASLRGGMTRWNELGLPIVATSKAEAQDGAPGVCG